MIIVWNNSKNFNVFIIWCHGIQKNDIRVNNTHWEKIQLNAIQQDDIQQHDIEQNDI
jgi:hypothetical protein